jgi:hypothetical protein
MHAKLWVEFWRRRGFENLVRTREVKAEKRARAKEQAELVQRDVGFASGFPGRRRAVGEIASVFSCTQEIVLILTHVFYRLIAAE